MRLTMRPTASRLRESAKAAATSASTGMTTSTKLAMLTLPRTEYMKVVACEQTANLAAKSLPGFTNTDLAGISTEVHLGRVTHKVTNRHAVHLRARLLVTGNNVDNSCRINFIVRRRVRGTWQVSSALTPERYVLRKVNMRATCLKRFAASRSVSRVIGGALISHVSLEIFHQNPR